MDKFEIFVFVFFLHISGEYCCIVDDDDIICVLLYLPGAHHSHSIDPLEPVCSGTVYPYSRTFSAVNRKKALQSNISILSPNNTKRHIFVVGVAGNRRRQKERKNINKKQNSAENTSILRFLWSSFVQFSSPHSDQMN